MNQEFQQVLCFLVTQDFPWVQGHLAVLLVQVVLEDLPDQKHRLVQQVQGNQMHQLYQIALCLHEVQETQEFQEFRYHL